MALTTKIQHGMGDLDQNFRDLWVHGNTTQHETCQGHR